MEENSDGKFSRSILGNTLVFFGNGTTLVGRGLPELGALQIPDFGLKFQFTSSRRSLVDSDFVSKNRTTQRVVSFQSAAIGGVLRSPAGQTSLVDFCRRLSRYENLFGSTSQGGEW